MNGNDDGVVIMMEFPCETTRRMFRVEFKVSTVIEIAKNDYSRLEC